MSNMPPQILEICKKAKITDYLVRRGVEIIKTGNRSKCKCPLPDHTKDRTPSFFITLMPDGTELFKCFGCGVGGNIITLVKKMEGKDKGVVGRLAKSIGMNLSPMAMPEYIPDPPPDEVLSQFCSSDEEAIQLFEYAFEFMKIHDCTQDVVDKVSKVYKMMDDMILSGDPEAISKTHKSLRLIMKNYTS